MRIQHNIPALNTYRHLSTNQSQVSKAMEKLSTGLRINRAADDAAGLTISEKMKSQIRGLSQTDRNILDGVSLIQTAEGGLANIQEILQRARELTVQAASDTLEASDRQAIGLEIEQLKQGIDGVANHTKFNEIPLLAPPKEIIPGTPGGASSEKVDILFFIDDSGTMKEEIEKVTEGISQFVTDLSAYGDVRVGTVSTVDDDDESRAEEDIVDRLLKLTPKEEVEKIQQHLKDVHTADGGFNMPYQRMIDYAPDGEKSGGVGYRNDSKKIFVLLTDTVNEDYSLPESRLKEEDVNNVLDRNNIYSYVFGIDISGSGDEEKNNFNFNYSYDGFANEIFTPKTAGEIAKSISPGLAQKIIQDTGLGSETELEFKPVILQVGPNEGTDFTMHLFDARTTNLKVDDLPVDSHEKALESLGKIDAALHRVASERSKFGSYQNALEHLQTNVSNSHVESSSAQSRIADADMAKEMASFTKSNILTQAAQAMMAQAMQLPQGILQLLK